MRTKGAVASLTIGWVSKAVDVHKDDELAALVNFRRARADGKWRAACVESTELGRSAQGASAMLKGSCVSVNQRS